MKFRSIIMFLMLITTFLLVGCTNTQFEVNYKINPTITVINDNYNKVSLEYNLGPLLILDVIEVNNKAQLVYLKKHLEILTLDLVIEYNEWTSDGFTYYLKGNKLNKKSTYPIEIKELIPYDNKIPGFVWLIKDGKKVKSLAKGGGTNYKPSTGLKKL